MDTQQNRSAQFHKILVCVSFSPRSAALISEAYHVSVKMDAELFFIHAGKKSSQNRDRILAVLNASKVSYNADHIIIEEGKADEVVLRASSRMGIDLIVAGALEKEGMLEYYIGSMARKIARKAESSVLLLTNPQLPGHGFHKLVAQVEWDDPSKELLCFAIAFAQYESDSCLHVVHEYELSGLRPILDDGIDYSEEGHMLDSLQVEEESQLMNMLGEFDPGDVQIRRACLCGRKGWEVVDYSRSEQADIMILSAPQRRLRLWDKLFQHDVEFALEKLPCALLLYRPSSLGRQTKED